MESSKPQKAICICTEAQKSPVGVLVTAYIDIVD